MDVVGHHDGNFQAISFAVVMNTTTKYEIARPLRQVSTKL
jgi:hypothetical protein